MSDVRLICWCLVLVTDRRGEESLESESDSSCVGHSLSATAALNDREKAGTPAYLTTKTSIKSVLCILCFPHALFVKEEDKIVHFVKFVIYLCAGNFAVPLNGWVEIAFSKQVL